jgi:myo-inositol-1(or 4)-monophosphatase
LDAKKPPQGVIIASEFTGGGDCYAYGLLALGQIDVIVECDLKPWDWAALLPVVTGAGGVMSDLAGNAPRVDGDGRIIAVCDPGLMPLVVAVLGEAG